MLVVVITRTTETEGLENYKRNRRPHDITAFRDSKLVA